MRGSAPILAVCLTGTAFAGDAAGGGAFSLAGSVLQMLAALAVVVGMIFLFRHLANRFLGGGTVRGGVPRYIRVVESRFLAPKKSLMLVEVGGEYLLLGSTGEGISLIKQIDMLENIQVVEDLSATARPAADLAERVRAVSGLLRKGGGLRFSFGKRMA